ncbi:LysE family translocator [Vibrio sp. WJH972]
MLAIFAYAFSVMYSPGPMNLLGLHLGFQGRAKANIGFYVGISTAMLILFISIAFLGSQIISKSLLPYISIIGCSYMLVIAWKISQAKVNMKDQKVEQGDLTFRDGLVMHILNPKAFIATLPIATIQFPAMGIVGPQIILWSIVLSVFSFGAPAGYALVGSILGKRVQRQQYFAYFNALMSILLVYAATTIAYQHAYLPLFVDSNLF